MEITIAARFCGPPQSGNGGYSCGRLAGFVDGDAEVTLRAPPPLDTPLEVRRVSAGVELLHGEQLIAEARCVEFTLAPPTPPSYDEAVAAAGRYRGLHHHPYGSCFVCGPRRTPGDALRIFTGPLGRDGIVAAPWTPDASLADERGNVRREFLWASVDCPGSWSVEPMPLMLLGRLAARFFGAVPAGEPQIVIGWPLSTDGRKHLVGSALFSAAGELRGYARGTWIALKTA